MKKKREQMIFKEKLEEKQKLIDRQTAQLAKIKDAQNAILNK